MHASLVRRSLGSLIPPKIATPKIVSGGSGASMSSVVDFYSKLPKGPAPPAGNGIKARYFDGKNASGKPFVAAIVGLFLFGYTIDYNSA
ncbi:mitochondrial F1-F0 ATP synthase subunit F of fungi-domain-containing protein [Rhizoctonia solani]|nr:mitochondrial F1-F0 ATP synthase subunit F of fungi-domain-containing protein [Rhizoctonia solani]